MRKFRQIWLNSANLSRKMGVRKLGKRAKSRMKQ